MAEALERVHADLGVEIVPILTAGDEASTRAVRRARATPTGDGVPGDKSRFTREIEAALLEGEVDLAVHSAKDVPGELPDGLAIVGVPERGDARDCLCGAGSLAELPRTARVGTSSLRRRSQLLARRPDLHVADLRGNVDTRLRRLAEGEHDAVVLAAAGLERLGQAQGSVLAEEEMTPAAGQGCLALEARADDERAGALAASLTHRESLVTLTAERALVGALDASCHTPVGAHARVAGRSLRLDAFVGLPDGSTWIRDSLEGDVDRPADLGGAVAERLLSAGAEAVLRAADPGQGTARPA